jgi:multidrug efflux pump subunit AcrA (membrane-fusion protein)
MLKYGLSLLAALALTLAVASVVRSRPIRKPAAPPAAPPQAVFKENIGAVGLVESSTENIAISVPVSGLVTAVYVKAGDRVPKGQKLFSLDDRDLQAELALRRTSLALARRRLEKLVSLPRPEDIPPAEARVQAAEAALADAQVQVQLMESVTDRRAIREEDLQRRRLAAQAARAKLDEAKADLTLLRAGAWAPDIEVARTEVAQSERQVQRIEADLDRLIVRAPLDGEILQCKVRVGEYAQGGPLATPLMLMGAVEALHVRADVDEKEAWRFRPGAPAVASVRGQSALRVPLEFVRAEPYVIPKKSLTGDSTERVDTRVLQVIYRLKGGDAPVYVGQQMDIYIEAATTGGQP